MRSLLLGLVVLRLAASADAEESRRPSAGVEKATTDAPAPWELEPSSRWELKTAPMGDSLVPPPKTRLEDEGIGSKTRVHDLFDRWTLAEHVAADRGTQYAEVTDECRGRIERPFALSAEEWANDGLRRRYLWNVDGLIERAGKKLFADFGAPFERVERLAFINALRSLAWQESRWQHYLRYKDWYFVVVSGGSYNKLDDWGITQVARSSFDPSKRLNARFFESKGHCSISSSLYYGFMEYYFCYLEARKAKCNAASLQQALVGAYNRYASGYSACHDGLTTEDAAFREYQKNALAGFLDHYKNKPWRKQRTAGR
ncbi:MAG: hypothetical protein HY078_00920 [Elusimicrobia bacterium]|nr:hypothetical protein [Elusimicrobiota bacterium]